jgi:hypothetical protein
MITKISAAAFKKHFLEQQAVDGIDPFLKFF